MKPPKLVILESPYAGNIEAKLPIPSTRKHWREVLGFMGQHAGISLVHDRYKELAKQHHPDTGGDSNKMAELNRAYREAKEDLT